MVLDKGAEIPTWSGDPVEFEAFATACRWYEKSLKSSERQQAASRIWARLTGPARAVVRHLDPDDYEADDGLSRLVDVLRKSPLQALPIADSFKRLDAWHMLKRLPGESIPKLLVREEDMFVQLQSALTRAREDRGLLAPPMIHANGSAATRTVQLVHIYMYHMYFGSRIKRLEKVRFPFRRYAAYGPSVIASNFAD